MNLFILSIVTITIIINIGEAIATNNETTAWNDIEDVYNNHNSKVLSRRKRFLIFPDGSSFQLVFCTQNHGYLRVGDIVWFGNTAALAWELPSDPNSFYFFKQNLRPLDDNRRSDNKHILYVNEDGRVIGKVPYRRKPIVNPAFAKRSVEFTSDTKALSKKKMHDMQKNANYLKSLHEKSIEFHRSGRKSLYVKVEKVLQALGWNGTECVLRIICESSREKKKQGTFLEEIIRATFTFPKGREFEAEHHRLYDQAARSEGSCATLYPTCENLHGLQLYDSE